MFTGIVTEVGKVVAVERETDRLSFRIEAPYEDLIEGDSIAVGGACLTVVSKGDSWFEVEAIVTTRSRTWFGDLQVGDEVNLERSVKIGDRPADLQGPVTGPGRHGQTGGRLFEQFRGFLIKLAISVKVARAHPAVDHDPRSALESLLLDAPCPAYPLPDRS